MGGRARGGLLGAQSAARRNNGGLTPCATTSKTDRSGARDPTKFPRDPVGPATANRGVRAKPAGVTGIPEGAPGTAREAPSPALQAAPPFSSAVERRER